MRKNLWLAVAMLLAGVGCPYEFGIGGRIDQAAARDSKEMLEKVCPAGMQRKKVKPSCTELCETECVAN